MEGFIPDYFREINILSITIRFVLTCICGGIIGIERGVKGRAAGFRTHILVCTGSAIAMMTGQYVYLFISNASDPARLGAQVISGIGFLGVGTIIITKSSKVRGLTTAAGLWAAACIGLAIGIGFYEAGVIGTITVCLVMSAMQNIDRFFYSRSKITDLYIEVENVSQVKKLISFIKDKGFKIVSMELQRSRFIEENKVALMLTIKKASNNCSEDIVSDIMSFEGIYYIEEV